MKKTGIELITEENKKDIYRKRAAPDMCALMAASYCLPQRARKPQYGEKMWPTHWPVGYAIFDFKPEDRIKELQKAGALIAAEIDRLQTQEEKK